MAWSDTEINFMEKRREIELTLEQSVKYSEGTLPIASCSNLVHEQLPNIKKEEAPIVKVSPY